MSKEEAESILTKVLLGLQICLGLWQVIKLTPAGAVIQGITGWLLRPFGLSRTYALLHSCPGCVFKRVRCFKMLPTDETSTLRMDDSNTTSVIEASYLGFPFRLQRNGTKRNMLFVNGEMAYYITDVNWYSLRFMGICLEQDRNNVVFLTNYKQFWEQVTTGRVMSFFEVLDCLIVENYDFRASHSHDLLLPVDLSVSEEKLLKFLNLAGFFLQIKKAYWVLSTVLSLTSAVLEFIVPLRVWIYGKINFVFCWAMHIVCDKLPYSVRKQVYSLGNWVENLKPSNDIEYRAVKADIFNAVIGGGAKASLAPALLEEGVALLCEEDQMTFKFECGHIKIQCLFDDKFKTADISFITMEDEKEIGTQSLRCNKGHSDFIRICTFISCLGKNRCGSLKYYGPGNKVVHVRSLMESTIRYVLNECPPVYELALQIVVVQ